MQDSNALVLEISRQNSALAMSIFEQKEPKFLAVWYIDKEDYNKASELLTKASEINRERQQMYEHRYSLVCDYFDIGLVFSNKDDFVAAKEFYTKSAALFEKQYQRALDYYMQGLKIDQIQENKPSIASDYNMLGELYVKMDNLDEAQEFFNQSISIAKQIDARPELAAAYHNLGLLYKKKG